MRRIFAREYPQALGGISDTWHRHLCNNGTLERPQYDPGGRRRWWTDEQLATDLAKLKAQATSAPVLCGAPLKTSRGALVRPHTRPESADSAAVDTAPATPEKTVRGTRTTSTASA